MLWHPPVNVFLLTPEYSGFSFSPGLGFPHVPLELPVKVKPEHG